MRQETAPPYGHRHHNHYVTRVVPIQRSQRTPSCTPDLSAASSPSPLPSSRWRALSFPRPPTVAHSSTKALGAPRPLRIPVWLGRLLAGDAAVMSFRVALLRLADQLLLHPSLRTRDNRPNVDRSPLRAFEGAYLFNLALGGRWRDSIAIRGRGADAAPRTSAVRGSNLGLPTGGSWLARGYE